MSKRLLHRYMKTIKDMEDKKYLFSMILYLIAPTIEGVKPSTIVTLPTSGRNLSKLWETYKEDFLNIYNVNYIKMKDTDKSTIVLFYNSDSLKETLSDLENIDFLQQFGYKNEMNINESILHLKSRFKNICPHEIGIFLGIPLEEVKVFMENPKSKCIFCGYWKVYKDIKKARKQFHIYDRARTHIILDVLKHSENSIII